MVNFEFTGTDWVEHGVVYHDVKGGRPKRAFKHKDGSDIVTSSDAYVTRENTSFYAKLYYPPRDKTYKVEIGSLVRQILQDNSCWVQKLMKNLRDTINKVLFEDPYYPVETKKDNCPAGMMRLHKMKYVIWKAVYLYNLKVSVVKWDDAEEHTDKQTKLEFFDGTSRTTRVVDEVVKINKNTKLDVFQLESWLGEDHFKEKFPYEDDVIAQKMN